MKKPTWFEGILVVLLVWGLLRLVSGETTQPAAQPTQPPPAYQIQILPGATLQAESVNSPVSPLPVGQSLKVGVVGDFGDPGYPAQGVADLAQQLGVTHILTVGDNNYPNGAEETYQTNTYAHYGQWIDQGRYFPALGNHDWGYLETQRTAEYLCQYYQTHFPYLPLQGDTCGRYYSVVVSPGQLEVFVLDSDYREPNGRTADSAQGLWLQTALANSTARYKVVVMHEPPYSSCSHDRAQPALRWPFQQWGASALFAGHCHSYERFDLSGLPLIVNGMGGGGGQYPFADIQPGSVFQYGGNNSQYPSGINTLEVTAGGLVINFITTDGALRDTITVP